MRRRRKRRRRRREEEEEEEEEEVEEEEEEKEGGIWRAILAPNFKTAPKIVSLGKTSSKIFSASVRTMLDVIILGKKTRVNFRLIPFIDCTFHEFHAARAEKLKKKKSTRRNLKYMKSFYLKIIFIIHG